MSIDNADLFQNVHHEEINPQSSRQPKKSYTREFLLSFGDLEICKRLPKGFDESLLSEFGSSSEQGFRRNDYGSSPPGKGEVGNYTRGLDRWDSRGSGRSDTDSQDSDSGRRYGSQFRRSWQNPEHDGLLGSGSLPRPPGYKPGASGPSSRANDQLQLKKSTDPYHPPRPFKAAPFPRRDKDSFNDETFGMDESTSEDRAEEERKRKAEFEMMRKEQHKILQENLKSKAMGKLKDDPMTELAASLDSGGDPLTNDIETSLLKPLQQNDSGKSSISSQGNTVRPRVPPGFANAAADKISGLKSLEHAVPLEAGKLETGHGNKDQKPDLMDLGDNHIETTYPLASKSGIKNHLLSSLSSNITDTSEISEILQTGNIGIDSDSLNGSKIMGETGRSTSILEKLFGGVLSINSDGPPDIIEDQNTKDDVWSPEDSHPHTSKFAHLFLDEEKKKPETGSSQKSNDLLSLIVGERSGLIASETKSAQQTLSVECNSMKLTTQTCDDTRISEVLCSNSSKPQPVSAFLMCEDLEQSILSNVGESSQPPVIIHSKHGMESEIPKSNIDTNASQHLLSLLQMGGIGPNSKSTPPSSSLDKGFPTESQDLGGERISEIQRNIRDGDAENVNSGKGLTLETLFGTAFMNELHSADAPVSVQRNSAISTMDVPESSIHPPVASDNGALASAVNDTRFKRVSRDDYFSQLRGGSHLEMEQPNLPSFGMRHPEEDIMTSLGLPGHHGSANAEMFPLPSNPQAKISEKLTALAQRQDNPPFLRGPFDMKPEIPHPIMHAHSSPQFNSAPVSHMRPMFHPLDLHSGLVDPQFNFMPQDAPIHHQFPGNLGPHVPYRHPSSGLPEFDNQLHPMLQQVHLPNNLPSSHHLPGFPGGNPPGYMQEHNPMQGFPFGQQQPNLGGHGIRLGPEHGDMNNHPPPQALQRLIEMELRSTQKPMHHPGSGHSRPVYGHELDAAGLWYR